MASSPPITWRNVNAPSAGGAADLFGQAQESFDGAMKAARDTKDGFEKGRTDRNTQEFMSQLQQYGSSEELAAAQESGALADLRGQFGSMVDQDKVSADAVTDRVTNLQGRETAEYDRDQMLTERAEKPIFDRINASIADIDLGQSRKVLENGREEFENGVRNSGLQPASQAKAMANYDSRVRASYTDKRSEDEHQYKLGQRAKVAAEEKRVDGLNAYTSQYMTDRTNNKRNSYEQSVTLARDMGLNVSEDGVVQAGNDPVVMREYQAKLAEQQQPRTSAQVREDLLSGMDQFNATPVEKAAQLGAFGVLDGKTSKLGASAQAELDTQVGYLTKQNATELERENSDWADAQTNNSFLSDKGDPNELTADLVATAEEDEGFMWMGDDKSEITRVINKALTGGTASPAMVRAAFEATGKDGGEADVFTKALDNIMQLPENVKRFKEAPRLKKEHNDRVDALNNNLIRAVSSATVKARSDYGLVPESVQSLTKRLKREQKRFENEATQVKEAQKNEVDFDSWFAGNQPSSGRMPTGDGVLLPGNQTGGSAPVAPTPKQAPAPASRQTNRPNLPTPTRSTLKPLGDNSAMTAIDNASQMMNNPGEIANRVPADMPKPDQSAGSVVRGGVNSVVGNVLKPTLDIATTAMNPLDSRNLVNRGYKAGEKVFSDILYNVLGGDFINYTSLTSDEVTQIGDKVEQWDKAAGKMPEATVKLVQQLLDTGYEGAQVLDDYLSQDISELPGFKIYGWLGGQIKDFLSNKGN